MNNLSLLVNTRCPRKILGLHLPVIPVALSPKERIRIRLLGVKLGSLIYLPEVMLLDEYIELSLKVFNFGKLIHNSFDNAFRLELLPCVQIVLRCVF